MQRLGEDGSRACPFNYEGKCCSEILYLLHNGGCVNAEGAFPATGKWMEEGNRACFYKQT